LTQRLGPGQRHTHATSARSRKGLFVNVLNGGRVEHAQVRPQDAAHVAAGACRVAGMPLI